MVEEKQTEVRQTTSQGIGDGSVERQTVHRTTSVSGVVVAQRVVYYIGGVIVALLLVRLILQLLGASQASGFVDFIYTTSAYFDAPFFGMFSVQPRYGQSQLELSTIVAIIVYALVTVGVAKLITLASPQDEI